MNTHGVLESEMGKSFPRRPAAGIRMRVLARARRLSFCYECLCFLFSFLDRFDLFVLFFSLWPFALRLRAFVVMFRERAEDACFQESCSLRILLDHLGHLDRPPLWKSEVSRIIDLSA